MTRQQIVYAAIAVVLALVLFGPVRSAVERGRRLTRDPAGADGNVAKDPQALAAEASATLGQTVTDEEYGLARMIASEETDSDWATQVAVAWVCVNDSQSFGGIVEVLTFASSSAHRGRYGTQTGRRYSTRLDPYEGHLAAARAVLSGAEPDRTGGAVNFFRPKVQDQLYAAGKVERNAADVDADWSAGGKERVDVAGVDADLWFYRRAG